MDAHFPNDWRKECTSALSTCARYLAQQDVSVDEVHAFIDVDEWCVCLVPELNRLVYIGCVMECMAAYTNDILPFLEDVTVWLIDIHYDKIVIQSKLKSKAES